MIGVFVPYWAARPSSYTGWVIQESGCWDWTGSSSSEGYGVIHVHNHKRSTTRQAHRVVYERYRGLIPTQLQLDHLCRRRCCVNPWHLEPVTHKENILRGKGSPAMNARKVNCVRGHPLSGANLYMRPDGSRVCRACGQEQWRRYDQRCAKKAQEAATSVEAKLNEACEALRRIAAWHCAPCEVGKCDAATWAADTLAKLEQANERVKTRSGGAQP